MLKKGVAQARPSLYMSKCHIVGNHLLWLNYVSLQAAVVFLSFR